MRKSSFQPTEGKPQGGLPAWREVVTPHPDVSSGRYQQAEFAADLWQVYQNEGSDEYKHPTEFYRRTFITEGSWGAQIVDELKPRDGEHVVIKKGFAGFANTPLDTILRRMGVTTCVVAGVITSVCVSSTVRGAVEHNYRMIVVGDGTADRDCDTHEGCAPSVLARTGTTNMKARETTA